MDCTSNAATTGRDAAIECRTIKGNFERLPSSAHRCTYCKSSKVPAGRAGRMYPGSFDAESEKNAIGTTNQITRNTDQPSFEESPGFFPVRHFSVHQARNPSVRAAATNTVHGTSASRPTGMQCQQGSVGRK